MKNTGLGVLACVMAICAVACNEEEKIDKRVNRCLEIVCPTGTMCNIVTGECDPIPDKCANKTCPADTTCNPDTGNCDPDNIDKCANKTCPADTTCNPDTGNCDPITDKCADKTCPADTECNPATGNCDPITDKCANKTCPADTECNPETGNCDPIIIDKCAGKTCPTDTKCNPATGNCDPIGLCAHKTCPGGTECNPETGNCDPLPDKCADKVCPENTVCNHSTGNCDPVDDPHNCPGGCNDTWEVCQNGECVNKNCIGVTCNDWEFCAISGKCSPWSGYCNSEADCESGLCNTSTHTCGVACEDEPENNIVPNWDFSLAEGSVFKSWSVENSNQYANGRVEISTDAYACSAAANLINTATSNARLISDKIHLPEVDFTGGNDKYDCSVYIKGSATISVGYRVLKTGETDKYDYKYKPEGQSIENSDYELYEFEMSVPPEKREVEVIVAANGTDYDGILVDAFTCIRQTNKCTGKVCDDSWQICNVAKKDPATNDYGACVAKSGFCDTDTNCSVVETCNTTTHLCEAAEGKCAKHADCADGALKFCDTRTNTCIDGDPCAGIDCKEWESCNSRTGICELKDGRCNRSRDCLKDKPACYAATHTCVSADFTYTVENAKECRLTGYDPATKQCPINIVPNGGFESWDDYAFSEHGDPYHLPVSWYGEEFEIAATHYATEIDPKAIHEYTTNPHSGSSALQIEFTKSKADRFTSEGFDVPGGSFDCAYWVRGKGDVRMHSYSSRGDAKKTDFVSYDTTDWVRVPFVIKEAASAMRLIFYVSNTGADKDHIQIDDVVCTGYSHY